MTAKVQKCYLIIDLVHQSPFTGQRPLIMIAVFVGQVSPFSSDCHFREFTRQRFVAGF